MDGMVEEHGQVVVDPLAHSTPGGNASAIITSVQPSVQPAMAVTQSSQTQRLVTTASIMQITIPQQLSVANATDAQVQSVIQANKQSVIQTATGNIQLKPGNVILVKPNSVIQTTPNIQTIQVVDADSDDDLSPRKRRDVLSRRPSYRKILNEIDEIAGNPGHKVESSSECDSNLDSELSSHSLSANYSVIPAGTILNSQGEAVQGLHTITMTNATSAGGLVQYTSGQDGPFYVPGEDGQLATIVVTQGGGLSGGSVMPEDQSRKREMRLLKNREAARECRRKKKEYIKCLENRVAVLENQNKALIDELKSLKELYCQTKTE
ncbi:cyclic AMP-responsive element-binding protein isoform X1 [Frankliniella occidentalis]|uniref:Cyclic AMP-responsive element-binding protein isoform X1 n=1 Tax=Frankliniella occidentalis TaxID=133901 RepID=A0A6J1SCM0_FRAOC|nr:cyclic AMP-responsive element-binding protein isoform X1 [Frankliniella occidentalis]XP_052120013.1 cyclic AMP-responsive element-binding protein isoform X1 [Frankliniella occidentalis]XP_052120015.1 cyclic AMP-responsive element-binding protein isoform X1 [Frankliniella occidentalis]XP_052120016.1 cyclic AMP-responsive element-binding protein isoform X1 [Frankliniella occidentalis]XP_052120017.1 cyclic AMP-responsive element-binding protein isoform X1 [Frankliniella occidentalis]XP_0521200